MNHYSEDTQRIRRGDIEFFKKLFEGYYNNLCILAKEYVKDDGQAEEIVEELFYNLWEKRKTLDIHTSVKIYLIRSVQNRCISYLRKLKTELKVKEDISIEHKNTLKYLPFKESQPIVRLFSSELEEKVRKEINELPEQCRKIFELSRFEEKSYNEIARELTISVNTVKTQMKIALKKLRDNLKEFLP